MSPLDLKLTLIGGPTLLIEFAGIRLLTDPTFDPPSQYESKGIVLEKKRGPAISAEMVGAVDAVLLSHDQHFDNFDRAGRAFLTKAKNTFTTKAGGERLGSPVKGLAPWETVHLDGLHVTATPARHGPPGIEPTSGDVVGFALGVDQPGDTVYVTGDTVCTKV
jgi:L-ascorbate metabolism protein UlaG (beta-lactamase superfamily)